MAGLRIAAVVTVSNRRDLTLACLESLCALALQCIPIRQPVSGARVGGRAGTSTGDEVGGCPAEYADRTITGGCLARKAKPDRNACGVFGWIRSAECGVRFSRASTGSALRESPDVLTIDHDDWKWVEEEVR